MYLPPAFRNEDIEAQHEVIRAHPLGTVITSGPGGLMANPIPCLLYAEGELGMLRLHLSRANPQIAELQQVDECLIVFQVRRVTSHLSGTRRNGRRGKWSRPGTTWPFTCGASRT
jgi:predicted FMN-binding regulatory protein PaiB